MVENPYLFEAIGKTEYELVRNGHMMHPLLHTDITLRDVFAAFAMSAILQSTEIQKMEGDSIGEAVAVTSYICADAMLTERVKEVG